MATQAQLELWLGQAQQRVDRFKAQLNEDNRKKKELVRPKTPSQIREKEQLHKRIQRSRDELAHSTKRKKDLEKELKALRKAEKASSSKSTAKVEKALLARFNKPAKRSPSKAKVSKTPESSKHPLMLPTEKLVKMKPEELVPLVTELKDEVMRLNQRLEAMEKQAQQHHKALLKAISGH